MKSIIAAIITCAVLFGVSYGASNYYMQTELIENETVEPLKTTVDQESTLPQQESEIKKVPAMPVAHRPEKSVSLEAVLQMSDSIKSMEKKLIQRDQRLAKEEQRVQLLFVDLETEQDQLQAFSEGVDSKVENLRRMTNELQQVLAKLDERKAELVSLEKKAGADEDSKHDELENKVNDVKGWFANLEAKQASDYLKEFANNGKIEFAASLLHKMPDRQKSKILGELKDPVLVDQLISALKTKPRTK